MSRKLRLPAPWGNQPADPADTPVAWLMIDAMTPERCLAPGFGYNPPRPCKLGARAQCPWGVRSEAARWCLWYQLENWPEQLSLDDEAQLLGVSAERTRKLVEQAMERFKWARQQLRRSTRFSAGWQTT